MTLNFLASRRIFMNIGLAVCVFALSACGGGSGTSSSDGLSIDALTYSPSIPGSGDPVSAVATVSYTGTVTSSGITYAWTQTSGPSVSLTGSSAATVYFTAPTVTSSTEVVLKLTISANSVSAAKSVTITVSP